MTDQRPSDEEASEPPRGAPEAPPELTPAERIFVRISWLQTVLAVAGVFTGAVALYAALHESAAVRRQSAAAVWPYAQVTMNNYATDEAALFELVLTNAGVGPARIEAMRVDLGGQAAADWRSAILSVAGENGLDRPYAQASALGRVMRPGDSLSLFSTVDPLLAARMQEAALADDAAIEICYCSIFDECWVSRAHAAPEPPTQVRQCPNYGEAAFTY